MSLIVPQRRVWTRQPASVLGLSSEWGAEYIAHFTRAGVVSVKRGVPIAVAGLNISGGSEIVGSEVCLKSFRNGSTTSAGAAFKSGLSYIDFLNPFSVLLRTPIKCVTSSNAYTYFGGSYNGYGFLLSSQRISSTETRLRFSWINAYADVFGGLLTFTADQPISNFMGVFDGGNFKIYQNGNELTATIYDSGVPLSTYSSSYSISAFNNLGAYAAAENASMIAFFPYAMPPVQQRK